MIEDIKNFRVNWIDGMKISKEHFHQLQEYVLDSVKHMGSTSRGSYDYGLIPSSGKESQDFIVSIDTHNKVKVSIKRLRALTPNGDRIEITSQTPVFKEDKTIEELASSDIDEGYFLLNTHSGEQVAFGEKNAKEMPPRFPYVMAKYSLSFASSREIEASGISPNQVPIAKVNSNKGKYEISQEYIPPCLSLNADEHLTAFYNSVEGFLKRIEKNAIQIVRKIRSKDNDNTIADTLFVPVDKIYAYLSVEMNRIEVEQYDLSPRAMIGILVSFARLFKNAVDIAPSENKEQLFNYFAEWTDMRGGDFERLFTTVINQPYIHHDVLQTIEPLRNFMQNIDKLFTILTQVDYIGKRKDMGIFVNENAMKEEKNRSKMGGNSSPSFLAE